MPKIALIQMTSSANLEENLTLMEAKVKEAAQGGAYMAIFPEMAYFIGPQTESLGVVDKFEIVFERFSKWAQDYEITLLPGSVREPVPHSPGRYFNTLPVFFMDGTPIAYYRKIHLFRADLGEHKYFEGSYCEAGSQIVVVEVAGIRVGLAICFDLRFPELFRALKKRRAQLVVLPSAFTVPTGKAHWDTLIRARAIENQFFMAAVGQTGTTGEGKPTYGHSLVVGPWGETVGELKTDPGILFVDIDPKKIAECSAKVSAWESQNADLLPIP